MGKFKDLTGEHFGRWTVIERGPDHITSGGYKFTTWKCICECGTVSNVIASRLLAGRSLSCGCLQREIASQYEDLSGNKYGRLLVLKTDENRHNKIHYICKCDCGNITSVRADSLKNGSIKSCGCLAKETAAKQGMKNVKHGGCRRDYTSKEKRLYNIWAHMKSRCRNEKDPSYKKYGALGIDYCAEWEEFKTFSDWAIANGYNNHLTIDRVDNTKGYCPENCRWADYYTQNNNRKNTIFINIEGEKHSLSEWCHILNMSYRTVYTRLKNGWEPNEALFKEVKHE